MSLIKEISSGEQVKILQFEKNEEFSEVLQTFLKNIRISHDVRKNYYKGYVSIGRIIPQLKSIGNYTDTVQYANNKKGIKVEIFTGKNKIFLIVHYSKKSETVLNDAIANSF